MSTELARIPDRVLPAPGRGDLADPVALRRMIGPSIVLAFFSCFSVLRLQGQLSRVG
jgi:hypothetical protein